MSSMEAPRSTISIPSRRMRSESRARASIVAASGWAASAATSQVIVLLRGVAIL
jgi:hypothetical protein